ncbi:hypothetical protein HDU92_009157 [Lobulomyces angularis]|nr:hypothetical protein HDU92_009157 [Lobulomyces angularis]
MNPMIGKNNLEMYQKYRRSSVMHPKVHDVDSDTTSDIGSEISDSTSTSSTKSVSFFNSVSVYKTYSKEDYDRCTIAVNELTKEDIMEVLQMRYQFQQNSIAMYRNRNYNESLI